MFPETSWFGSIWRSSRKSPLEPDKAVIGVIAFEVTSLMSKVVHLWQCLSDKQVVRIREEILESEGVRRLVLGDDEFLVGLVCGEIINNIGYVAKAVGRLGKKCTDASLQGFEQVFDDLVQNDVDAYGWEYAWKKMERKVKKMGRLIGVTSSLYHELEVLAELEQVLRRMKISRDPNIETFQQKIAWRRQEVKNLREVSLWGRTYDYTVRLLARSIFTIFGRIKYVFQFSQTSDELGTDDSISFDADYLPRSHSYSALMQSSVHPSENNTVCLMSGPLRRSNTTMGLGFGANGTEMPIEKSASCRNKMSNRQYEAEDQSFILRQKRPHWKSKRLASIGPFKGCMVSGSESPIMHSCLPVGSSSLRLSGFSSGIPSGAEERTVDPLICGNSFNAIASLSLICSKIKVLNAPPSTLGGAALALHYANIIIFIEKLVASPHLMDPDARDCLYNMLPASLRGSVRAKLKSYKKNLDSSVYDADLGPLWGEVLKDILEWLAPLARNMIRWQSERNFEQQHLVSQTNVLLVQTLFFADQAKTEAEMTELLVGLNYLWRFEKKLNEKAFLQSASSIVFDDYLYIKG